MIRALVLAAALAAPASAADLAAIPFWKTSAGWWQSDNTYFAPNLDYNIRLYNSLVHIEVAGRKVTETEYKFYAPSKLAMSHGDGKTKEGEGTEVITVITYDQTDEAGTVRQASASPGTPSGDAGTTITVLNADTAQRVSREPGATTDLYRMLISQPTPDKRYIANYGIVAKATKDAELGSLRGYSTFFGTRIDAKDFADRRAQLRAKNNVHAVVAAGPDGKPVAKRLD